jgi:hypothetical protein
MNKIVGGVFVLGLLLMATGCAHVATVGRGAGSVGVYFGDLGITGYDNTVTVQNGSKLTKLSFIGDGNSVIVEDLVTLPYIQFWGSNNTVSVPEWVMMRIVDVGRGNRVIRRPASENFSQDAATLYAYPRRTAPSTTEITPAETTPAQPTTGGEKKPALKKVPPGEPTPAERTGPGSPAEPEP